MLTIEYAISMEYGVIRRRIINNNDATKAFHNLTGRKTLKQSDIQDLRAMGVEVREIQCELEIIPSRKVPKGERKCSTS